MRVLFLTRYDWSGASSRYRSYQYYSWLRGAGIEVVESPLFGRGHIEDAYAGRPRDPVRTARSFAARLAALAASGTYDLLWIEKELLPWVPGIVEWLLAKVRVPYVVDYDDPTFHSYDLHRSRLVRDILGKKIDRIMAGAVTVIAGNSYLGDRARAAGARNVEIIPTVIDLERYPARRDSRHEQFVVGWIGSPSNQVHVELLAPTLRTFCSEVDARVRAIGFKDDAFIPGINLEIVRWSERTEVEDMHSFDVGIMPLRDDPWSKGKCGFKLIQYMGCSLPVIASAVGANNDIVVDGETGYLVHDDDEWLAALRTLAGDSELRRTMGRRGRERVEALFSLESRAPQLEAVLRAAARRR